MTQMWFANLLVAAATRCQDHVKIFCGQEKTLCRIPDIIVLNDDEIEALFEIKNVGDDIDDGGSATAEPYGHDVLSC